MDKAGTQDPRGALERTVDSYALPANPSPADLAQAIQLIFSKPHVEKVTISPGKPIEVEWSHLPGDTLLEARDISIEEALQRIDLEELVPKKRGKGAQAMLVQAFNILGARNLLPSRIVVGPSSVARPWLGIPAHFPLYNRLMGVHVSVSEELPQDVMVILGAASTGAPVSHAVYGVKLLMED